MYPEEMDFLVIFYLIYGLFMLVIGVGTYVLQALSFYTISKRRGIQKPWLSWIPVGDVWILGCISDQFRYVAKGQVKNKRKALLILEILLLVVLVVFYACFGTFLMQALVYDDSMMDPSMEVHMLGAAMGMLCAGLIMMGLAIALAVIQYMALYDLYLSCDPKNGVIYLVVGILVSVAMPVLLFMCRNKDLGMPPRKQTLIHESQPCPQPDQEPWQAAQPTKEPWEE